MAASYRAAASPWSVDEFAGAEPDTDARGMATRVAATIMATDTTDKPYRPLRAGTGRGRRTISRPSCR